jgi:hypothetical protein
MYFKIDMPAPGTFILLQPAAAAASVMHGYEEQATQHNSAANLHLSSKGDQLPECFKLA